MPDENRREETESRFTLPGALHLRQTRVSTLLSIRGKMCKMVQATINKIHFREVNEKVTYFGQELVARCLSWGYPAIARYMLTQVVHFDGVFLNVKDLAWSSKLFSPLLVASRLVFILSCQPVYLSKQHRYSRPISIEEGPIYGTILVSWDSTALSNAVGRPKLNATLPCR